MRKLCIVSVAFPLAPVRSDSPGGAEQVLWTIDSALCAAGHRSIVIAQAGAQVSGTLRSVTPPAGPLDDEAKKRAQAETKAVLERALAEDAVDLVHFHGVDFAECLPSRDVPALATLHLPPSWYNPAIFRSRRRNLWLNCVSDHQRARCPDSPHLLGTVRNGVRVAAEPSCDQRGRDYVLALGRICPEKGFHFALDAATVAGIPLCLAGKVFAYADHERYFELELKPRIEAGGHQYVGPAFGSRKQTLLTEARCVLIPSVAPETSSLVAMEAMACGTPVVAFKSGALPEIVEHGRTGFLVDDVNGMARAIKAVHQLDRNECRRRAREVFTAERMASEYLELYRHVIFEAEWRDLFTRCPSATPFQHPAWVGSWWRRFRSDLPSFSEFRDSDGVLRGVLPADRTATPVTLAGTGITDYNDALAEAGTPLHLPSGGWRFDDVPSWSPLLPLARSVQRGSSCPVAEIGPVPAKLAKNLRYARRRLERLGSVDFDRATHDTFDEHMQALFRSHAERWRSAGEGGVLSDPAVQTFHRTAAWELLLDGLLYLYGLRLNGELRGALYGFARGSRFFYYLSGFDPELAAYSPGSLLIEHAWNEAGRAGLTHFDFLRGSEAYKYAWGASDEWTHVLASDA